MQGVLMDYLSSASVTLLPLMRVLRVIRIIKIVPMVKGLKMMLSVLLWSLPALFNVACVLILIMFVYVSQNLRMQWKDISEY